MYKAYTTSVNFPVDLKHHLADLFNVCFDLGFHAIDPFLERLALCSGIYEGVDVAEYSNRGD